MDHLPLPSDPILPLTEVPYICKEPYDVSVPFLEYPRRRGKPWLTPKGGEAPSVKHEKLFPIPTRDLESFFQTWLGFGLLAELLAELFDRDKFVAKSERDDGGPVVSTKQLQALTERRLDRVGNLDRSRQKQIYLHAVRCIDLTVMSLLAAAPDFNSAVKNSIASIAEFLGNAIDRAHKGTFSDAVSCTRPFVRKFYTEDMKAAMVAAGWCPNDIKRVTDKFLTTQLLYFFSKMKKPPGIANHRDCTENVCRTHSLGLSQHRTRHCETCTNENKCEDISIDYRHVVDILRSGALPFLRITSKKNEPSKVTVQLSSSGTDATPYVAISHVWADGLGESSANSLPQCQLARLGRMLDPFAEAGTRPLVWLDTLCCPVNPEAKRLALLQMRRTYAEANKTLILDSSLYNFDSQDLSVAEIHARILTSGWMRRLWTLQEGALASDPWVQFKDGPVRMNTIYRRLKELHDENLNHRRLVQDMFRESQSLALPSYYSLQGVPELSLLDRALSYRNTTVALDEAPCIATLMNLNVSEILPLSGENRMCKLWELLAAANSGSLPRKMIFLDGPKLKSRGYRWAPSTFLPPGEDYPVSSRITQWRGPQGKRTAQGLMAEFPSYRFRPYPGPSPSPIWDVLVEMRQVHFIFKDQNRDIWCRLSYKPTSMEITQTPFVDLAAKGDLAVILREEPSDQPSTLLEDTYREGRLVTVTEEKEDVLHAILGDVVFFEALSQQDAMVYDAAERLMREFRSWELEDSTGLEVAEQESKERITKLRAKCKEMTRRQLKEEPGLEDAVLEMLGEDGEGWQMWIYVATWFGHVGEGWRVNLRKMWCVD
ncbi:MAG: hypothetical protein ALECFALPRED_005566 [Alectoria fallacina]|uniref:Heterokaryon incompatibility domain-containing protein n=1 Tax=Alectoria fallacina TaxID=1903189 RepID=A0A8H3G5E3_9LECA|nr:MAG: hypothetical protein ALECFALPRED_005566 [Alectoria fallacina]